ncbi:MAG: hypothetical protein QXP34_03725 [Candidatus Aenigmatarchaeota archaeon]
MINIIKDFISFYIVNYQPYILIYWTIFLIIYFSIRYRLYRSTVFYLYLFLFIIGFIVFKEAVPENIILVEKQRIRYLSLARNFVEHRIFAHVYDNYIIFDRHLAYCSIPIILGILLFGIENVFKFTYWYNIISILVIIYFGYKIFKDTKKSKYFLFVLLLVVPFLYHEGLNPYNYPEFSNALIFSIFLYLLFFKKDEKALLILPLLLSSGNEYIFFFVFTPLILYSINRKKVFERSIFYYFVYFLVAFPYIFLTFFDHLIGDIELFFRKNVFYNTLNVIISRPHIYYPFVVIFFFSIVSIVLSIKKKQELIETIPSVFYLAFFIIISTWGVTPFDYFYEHFLPNLLPLFPLILNKFEKISVFLSILSIYFLIFYFRPPLFYSRSFTDNLFLLKDISQFIPEKEILLFPRKNEIEYFNFLRIKFSNIYTFDNVDYNVLKNRYYLITTEFMENNENFMFNIVHKEFTRFCNLVHRNLQWKIYECFGYDEKLILILETFKKQRFG